MPITCMQRCGYAMRLFLDLGWSLHTLLCAHTSFGTSAHPFVVCCCLMLCAFSRPRGWGENRKTRNATFTCKVQCCPKQTWLKVLPQACAELSFATQEKSSGLLHFDPRMALKGRGAGSYRQGRAFQVPYLPQMGLAALEETDARHWHPIRSDCCP